MMKRKKIILLLALLLLCAAMNQLMAQAPAMFNYQGALRQNNGQPVAGRNISLRTSILEGSENGTVVFSETRQVRTSDLGLYALQIGSAGGSNVKGSLSAVDWGAGPKYIRIEADTEGNGNFLTAGSSQLLSVPYALYAGSTTPAPIGPWFEEKSKRPATSNSGNIYQSGNVGILTDAPVAPLDVKGAARFGQLEPGAVIGANSAAFGQTNVASGQNAAAFGWGNVASGTHSTVFGTNNIVSGSRGTAFGTLSKVLGHYSTSFGNVNTVNGWSSVAMGGNHISSSNFEVVIGTNNAFTTGNETVFQIGNGNPDVLSNRQNAVTVLKSGYMGIGTSTAFPTSTLQVNGSFSTPIRALVIGVVGEQDHTILVQGNISLPPPTASNQGRVYCLVNDTEARQQFSGSIRQSGKVMESFELGTVSGTRGVTLQSDGKNWVVVQQY